METANVNTGAKKRKSSKTAAAATQPTIITNDLHISPYCQRCGNEEKAKRREISQSAWQALLYWQEVEKETVDHPMCQPCYNEIREILIDRADEILEAAKNVTLELRAG